jgi:hypothetical protein
VLHRWSVNRTGLPGFLEANRRNRAARSGEEQRWCWPWPWQSFVLAEPWSPPKSRGTRPFANGPHRCPVRPRRGVDSKFGNRIVAAPLRDCISARVRTSTDGACDDLDATDSVCHRNRCERRSYGSRIAREGAIFSRPAALGPKRLQRCRHIDQIADAQKETIGLARQRGAIRR